MASLIASNGEKSTELLRFISENIIGRDLIIQGPFGIRKVLYADYTASGRSLACIEDYIREHVLPWYGNTHTMMSATSCQVSHLREEARLIVRNAVNATEYDCVLFSGSGTTGAIGLLVHAMGLHPLCNKRELPIVIHGPFEHHSNLLPWRQMGAKVVPIRETSRGELDLVDLENTLQRYAGSERTVIGTFNAASNLTGVFTDTDKVTELLHRYGALAFWDYATAAPYAEMNMNPIHGNKDPMLVAKDAIFFSPHKFIGGVDTPGILVAKKHLFRNKTPFTAGGGTVFYVTPNDQLYLQEVESREEGGTPAIVGSIRAGLALQLKQSVGVSYIMKEESKILKHVLESWGSVQELILLGPTHVSRLPVFSFLIRHTSSGRFLHHNYVCALLNDLFGIQSRGGCSCAGPYGQALLGIGPDLAETYQKLLMEDRRLDRVHLRRHGEYSEQELLRPGMTRLSFTYFMTEQEVDFIIQAVVMVAKHGWKLLPVYDIDPASGQFKHNGYRCFKDRKWLGSISYKSGKFECTSRNDTKTHQVMDYKKCLAEAQRLFDDAAGYRGDVTRSLGNQHSILDDRCEEYRWFLYPREAQEWLKGENSPKATSPPPFTPKQYSLASKSSVEVEPLDSSQMQSSRSDLVPSQSGGLLKDFSSQNSHLSEYTCQNLDGCVHPWSRNPHVFCECSQQDGSESVGDSPQNPHPSTRHVGPQEGIHTRDIGVQCDLTMSSNVGLTDISNGQHVASEHSTLTSSSFETLPKTPPKTLPKTPPKTPHKTLPEATLKTTTSSSSKVTPNIKEHKLRFYCPPKVIMKPTLEALEEYSMIREGDSVLVCLSGGKDSLSLLHAVRQYQHYAKAKGVSFKLGAVTVDPKSSSYNPAPLIPYLKSLGVPYFYEEQGILDKALEVNCSSICSFCSRMKRGRLYSCARREGYNVLAFGQHLDDLAESFLMAVFHNGFLRTMKAHYTIKEGDLRVIRPFVYVREKDLRMFANQYHLPVIPENCPACFETPKERQRMKQLLAAQEILSPRLFASMQAAMKPLMARNRTGIESRRAVIEMEEESDQDLFQV